MERQLISCDLSVDGIIQMNFAIPVPLIFLNRMHWSLKTDVVCLQSLRLGHQHFIGHRAACAPGRETGTMLFMNALTVTVIY